MNKSLALSSNSPVRKRVSMFPIAIQDRSLCMIFSAMVLTMNILEVTVPKLENITSHTKALLTATKAYRTL